MSDEAVPVTDSRPDHILLVDDNPTNLQVLFQTLSGRDYKLLVAKNGEAALEIAKKVSPDLILLDIMMPGMDGYETCRRLKADETTKESAVIFLSALSETEDKVKGLEQGAVDFITKPFQPDEVTARVETHLTVQRLKRELRQQNQRLGHELRVARELLKDASKRVEGPLLGESAAVRALREGIGQCAADQDPVLLVGSPGSGAETTARAIHHGSERKDRAFIHVHCGTLQSQESETLFGVTDAAGKLNDQGAKLGLADGGTLYLDGVLDLPTPAQVDLAALLAEMVERREAGETPSPDVRVIAYAPEDPVAALQSGRFHNDLYGLLTRNQLRLPALVERRDDITPLVGHYLRQHGRRLAKNIDGVSDASMKRLRSYAWPGNIRELENVLERAIVAAESPMIEIDKGMLEGGMTLGSYKLEKKLGEGGMGEVWLARHQLLARPAAVKLIRPDKVGLIEERTTAVERFRREAQTTANLRSPHTVELYDFGIGESGSFYYVMELLEGMDLLNMLKQSGPLSPGRVVALLEQACRSLAEAHEAGLVHRDIKPANIFVCQLGPEYDFVKVLDWGIVRLSLEQADAHLTQEGQIQGTPAFMPPELFLSKDIDGRADIYALGCVAFWLLTGRYVFEGGVTAMLVGHAKREPLAPSRIAEQPIPEGLDDLVLACLEKDPDSRPATAMDLAEMLASVELEKPWTQKHAREWWAQQAAAADEE